MLEDRYLVWGVKRGSEWALRRIYNRCENDLLTLAANLLGRTEKAEDVLQDVFMRFIESIDTFTLTGSLKGYLATCVANRARDHLRKGRYRTGEPIEAARAVEAQRQDPLDAAIAPRTPDSVRTEIYAIREMAAAGDVKGLATVLSTGPFESKLVAANFLAKMAPMPALETVAVYASGETRLDRHNDRLRLRCTAGPDWIELADSMLIVHSGGEEHKTTQVRLTYDVRGDRQQWQEHQKEFAALRQERAKLEGQVAGGNTLPTDVNDLRQRLEEYSHILDGMDEAIYISAENGGLKLQSRFRKREARVYLSDDGGLRRMAQPHCQGRQHIAEAGPGARSHGRSARPDIRLAQPI